MIYNAMEIADFIINKCYMEDAPISNLHLQKVLYFTWIDYYRQTGKTLFIDDICAWNFGPVVPEVYYEYCAYGGRPINIKCETELNAEDKKLLNNIVSQYTKVPVNILVGRTHQKGTPWDIIYKDGVGNREKIPFDLIRQKECGEKHVS